MLPLHDVTLSPIPLIDISDIDETTGREVINAAAECGFLFVKGKNLGFTATIIQNAFELSQQFFACPLTEKQQIAHGSSNLGWAGIGSETLDPANQKGDSKETVNFGASTHKAKTIQGLPHILRANEREVDDFISRCDALCSRLLQLFALGLEIAPEAGGKDWFVSRHDRTQGSVGSVLRWLHYPAVDETALDQSVNVRAGAHSDYGSLTLLFQRKGEPGLEILGPSSSWNPVPTNPPGDDGTYPSILVNIGDLLQFWTDGFLKSTIHRVIFPKGDNNDRFAIAYFCHPLDDVNLKMVPSRLIGEKRAVKCKGHPMTADEYLRMKLKATYDIYQGD